MSLDGDRSVVRSICRASERFLWRGGSLPATERTRTLHMVTPANDAEVVFRQHSIPKLSVPELEFHRVPNWNPKFTRCVD